MEWLDFRSFSMWVNLAIFAAAGVVVWLAGTRLSGYAEEISDRTGVGAAFIGALMLGGITSLPEVATTVTASLIGNAPLAVNNLFGGVAMQVAILAVADAVVKRSPLSVATAQPVVLLQGTLLVLVLGVAVAGIALGEPAGLPVGLWTAAIFLLAVLGFYLIQRYEGRGRWQAVTDGGHRRTVVRVRPSRPREEAEAEREGDSGSDPDSDKDKDKDDGKGRGKAKDLSMGRLVLYTTLAALAILTAGFALAKAGDALAAQTGLGASFVGVAFVAIATSLPEVSTTLAAARLGRYDMAFSNIFGTNLLDTSLLFLADVAYAGPPVLNEVGDFSLLGATLGILVTAVYLAGLVERQDRMVWRFGLDSLAVLALYAAGLFALYMIR